ncbi:murein hydrolase activator EnvC family protein [Aequorivita viscosa]|uniref:Septal ring factor EnvC, activator of murein hydrolases AmiA and AmiB n=1 Tax=Aequorivita viscosa TaxID=797419 RepID=A0A1M6H899_9FLAO|nr:peptidoglycan DD-metalloendopeptidase family protein [Aequorivita viscosa]SDW89284.1 Septal ring factor EnvC, activator of murein hydrolases AmiA and AmiB [Aequorivita viscosa]SHJ18406.1 Septal ring factor EnvC, activator of murein hydrolases AmiA and AmiB [Aequorivita viscosa]
MKNIRLYLAILICFVALPATFAQSDRQKELEEKRQAILNEIKQINSLLFKTKKEEKSVLSQLEDVKQRISATENLIRITNQQANLLTRNINSNINKISALRKELKVMKDDYAEMVQKSYKSKSQQSRVMFLLSSDNFLQAYKRVQYMKQYAAFRKKQGEGIRVKTEELQKLNESLIAQKKTKQKLIAENEVAKKQLNEERKAQQDLVATLKKDESKFTAQIRAKQKEADKIDKEIDDLIKAAIAEANRLANEAKKKTKKAETSGGFDLTAEDKALAASFSKNKGKLPWPVEKGMVIKSFGKHQHPQFPNVTTNSSGVEIATEDNAPVRAIFEGQVMAVQVIKGANKVLFIQHGDYISVYSHLNSVSVKKGDRISTKQKIGTVGKSPTEGRTILKFYIYKNKTKINPADWIYKM